ncbi:sugar lactone lactonase YvrE [Actinoalloteichus hoggarensis]|uniref:L-arabinolactonase n=1 Tax=Actinoalloteichus hoggarensis TaxID=1470176 RepID=A0A221VZ90_9PSEU|nr:SMP-30/gluconolactonase/LRE family protein [Actinoalloteichus hoggarensis]ASO18847.1 L-arabinolactonase [Actinoalloteichus hoggarensis]MBB5920082.1 sugar lactone lactonase YvrE [Actinoalloteichus hoggarensis]
MVNHANCEVAVDEAAAEGACPTWDITAESLLWVDTPHSRVHRYQPITGVDATMDLPQRVGAVRPRVRGGLVASLRDGIALIDSDDTRRWLVYWARPAGEPGTAAVDPAGRLWAGSHAAASTPDGTAAHSAPAGGTASSGATGRGWLARVEPDGAAATPLNPAAEITGLGWSPDWRSLYVAERGTRRVDVLSFDRATGAVRDRRPLFEAADVPGEPNGFCVDAAGCLWVPIRGGAALHRYTPEGVLDRRIELPAAEPTGCCFGGFGFTDLYVTTATPATESGRPQDGRLLVLPDLDVGLPDTLFLG